MGLFTELNEKLGRTIIQVTHEAEMAAYGKRTITFRDGIILKDERAGGS
jgi:putative ABC transport system ATP-binding protein